MQFNANEISELIKKKISDLKIKEEKKNEGVIISINDGIIWVNGILNVMQGEMLELPNNLYAIALNLEQDFVGAIVMGKYIDLKEGMIVKCTGKILEIPVGNQLLGRVINTLGKEIDGKGYIKSKNFSPIEKIAPGVIDREPINKPLQTGYTIIDSMIPIGRGQRELIIGDRHTGKTTLAIDTIINQRNKKVKCIYVAIGQKASTIYNLVSKLKEYNALSYTVIVVATASEPASMQYLAPYSGCTIGEFFRDNGEDALIVYDDLSKQAIAYRQISLLLKRPPGREAFPGDIFYLHARLLERSACVNSKYIEKKTKGKIKNKTGSLTALPIIETQSGDVSAFVPTNVISITDGQIFLETNLFNSGIRPAINSGISVSRVGSSAQTNLIKKLSSGIKNSIAQYNELSSFSQFTSDLDYNTRKKLENGQKITEMLKQNIHTPMSVIQQSIILFIIKYNFIDKIKLNKIKKFTLDLLDYISSNKNNLINLQNDINNFKFYLNKIIKKFKKNKYGK
ncbi:ATP synthase subunit alpha [Candidatus Annandia adelgestsuga]|uniref:ATP synthase subunit alpha n=1 Tax=Candidatus Annandia adelgestsuga TaxID=1302411 RepID=A0A3Q9CLE0_9ENTR|nr:F0F1 ATP synthase subunit alpha [Candidatus Annandia adelgestsuga]AZP36229.1 ATP synthase subunit alpha [Candidatus Annandia adelgestsuga]